MSDINYLTVFKTATKLASPYASQCRLACGPDANPNDASTLLKGADCQSQLPQMQERSRQRSRHAHSLIIRRYSS